MCIRDRDNIEFASVGKLNSDEIKKSGRLTSIKFAKRSARYVKVIATTKGKIEAGAPGAGNDAWIMVDAVSYTHLRAHETVLDLVCRLLLENKQNKKKTKTNKKE